jgi:hypothetical protein
MAKLGHHWTRRLPAPIRGARVHAKADLCTTWRASDPMRCGSTVVAKYLDYIGGTQVAVLWTKESGWACATCARTPDVLPVWVCDNFGIVKRFVCSPPIVSNKSVKTAADLRVDARNAVDIREGSDPTDAFDEPFSSDGLKNERWIAIRNHKSIVVVARGQMSAVTALAVSLEQLRHDIQCFGGRAGALQPKAKKVHSGQCFYLRCRTSSVKSLVTDDYTVFVRAHLRAPNPKRSAQEYGVRVSRLRDCDICAAQLRLRFVVFTRKLLYALGFVPRPVAVLAEQHNARDGTFGRS